MGAPRRQSGFAGDPAQAARNAAVSEELAKDRDDIGDDDETLRVIQESKQRRQDRTKAYLERDKKIRAEQAEARKAGAPGAASSATEPVRGGR